MSNLTKEEINFLYKMIELFDSIPQTIQLNSCVSIFKDKEQIYNIPNPSINVN